MSKLGINPRVTTLTLGPPGVGKSWFAGSVTALGKTLLLACKPREKDSIGYTRWGDKVDAEVYHDPGWIPTLHNAEVEALKANKVSEAQARVQAAKEYLRADAYLQMLKRLHALYQDEEYDNVVIDPFTDAAVLVEHEILKPYGVGSPGELKDTFGFYRQLKDKAEELTFILTGLKTDAAKKPKNVIVCMHTQPPKEDQVIGGETKKSSDKVARGIEYEGSVLPMIEGAYRRKMTGDFDIVIYSGFEQKYDAKKREQRPWYYIQVSPDRDRHSKIAVGITPQEDKLDNDFVALMEAIDAPDTEK